MYVDVRRGHSTKQRCIGIGMIEGGTSLTRVNKTARDVGSGMYSLHYSRSGTAYSAMKRWLQTAITSNDIELSRARISGQKPVRKRNELRAR